MPSLQFSQGPSSIARYLTTSLLVGFVLLTSLGCATSGSVIGFNQGSEAALYSEVKQLTFAGLRSGEGYFDSSGQKIVFQSERDPENPFYQIYRMDLSTGETEQISNGRGKTTCGWIHPLGAVVFASTHLDPDAETKQKSELEERASGNSRRYRWGFDPHYDLFLAHDGQPTERLTSSFGYDAEASYSPDGRWIAFSSNRHAYTEDLDPGNRERLAEDPSFFIDLYLFDSATGQTRRLTTTDGYDGGPFFSPNGERIVWRRFSEDGTRAEIHSIRIDGSDERILTRLGAMSWAPFYHPSGDYIIFTTNLNGFDNFELYLVDAEGKRDPVRVTSREGFDGLPVFSPEGGRLLWTSNRTPGKQSQLFLAKWDDAAARSRLRLSPRDTMADATEPLPLAFRSDPAIVPHDLRSHVRALTDDRTQGRRAGTLGEEIASNYLERVMASIGLTPDGADGGYRHPFEFTSGLSLGENNELTLTTASGSSSLRIESDWRPLAFSHSGDVLDSPVAFLGYGLVAPAHHTRGALDAYSDIDVSDRWVMIFRGLPTSLDGPQRQSLLRYASLRYKAMTARDHGARGVLFVSGPLGHFRNSLVPLRFDASLAGTRIAVLSITDEIASALLESESISLREAQERASQLVNRNAGSAETITPFELSDTTLGGQINLITLRASGNNIIGRLQLGETSSAQSIVLGAHYDHLGHGESGGSLASGKEVGGIHSGADDNASGVAVLLEIAQELAHQHALGVDLGRRDFIFAAWSGEELGLLGSSRWVADHIDPHTQNPHKTKQGVVAYLNFDMVGRLRDHLVIQGLGSSDAWSTLLETAAAPLPLSILAQADSYLPTDATSFYTAGVPILSAFTGIHSEYHTPNDTLDRLNFEGATEIALLGSRIAKSISRASEAPNYLAQKTPSSDATRSTFRVFLGTVPDYAQTEVTGVRLTGVAPGGPAEKAGVRGRDIIVEVDRRPIENLYDYTYALEALRVGEPAEIVVLRNGKRISLEIIPGSRD